MHTQIRVCTHMTEETLSKVSAEQCLFIKCCSLLMHLSPARSYPSPSMLLSSPSPLQ